MGLDHFQVAGVSQLHLELIGQGRVQADEQILIAQAQMGDGVGVNFRIQANKEIVIASFFMLPGHSVPVCGVNIAKKTSFRLSVRVKVFTATDGAVKALLEARMDVMAP